MKNINLEFIKVSDYIPTQIIEEKLENLDLMVYYFHSKKLAQNNKEDNSWKRNDIIKFLFKEYFNILIIENNKNKEQLEIYKEKLALFLKDKIKNSDIKIILEEQFPQEIEKRKDIMRLLVSTLNIEIKNENSITLQYDELIINEEKIKELIKAKINENVSKQLMKVWILCQLNTHAGLDNVLRDKNIETTHAKKFLTNALNYELVIKEKLFNNVSYETFWESFEVLNKSFKMNKEIQKVLVKAFSTEMYNKTDKLFTIKDNVFYFNIINVEGLLKNNLNKDSKKELTKLYLFHKLYHKIKSVDCLSESMSFIDQYAIATKEKLFAQVSKNYINGIYDEIKGYFNKTSIPEIQQELGTYAADTMILQIKNVLILNLEMLNKKIYQENSSEEEKNQFALIYILNQLFENKDLEMKTWNSEDNTYQKIEIIKTNGMINEKQLLKTISGLNNNKLLNVIHNFFKNIELDVVSQERLHSNIMLQLLKSNILQTGKNQEKTLIISKHIIIFNEDNMKDNNMDILLKMYVFDKIFKNAKNIMWLQDPSIHKISEYSSKIIEQLKNKVSEKDIYLKIKEIEKELEIEPIESYPQFHEISIQLDAKNDVSFMKNDMLIFKHEKKTSLSTVFVRLNIIDKLLNKTVDSDNVKELVKLCLFSKIHELKDGVIRNKNDNLIILNENCIHLLKKIPCVVEKIYGKVLEKEVDTAIIELNENFPFDSNEDYIKRNVINEIKRMVGIKVKSPFKHLL